MKDYWNKMDKPKEIIPLEKRIHLILIGDYNRCTIVSDAKKYGLLETCATIFRENLDVYKHILPEKELECYESLYKQVVIPNVAWAREILKEKGEKCQY